MRRWLILSVTACLTFGGLGLAALDRWITHTEVPNLILETSTTVLDRNGDLLRAYTVADGRWRLPAKVEDVDPRFFTYLTAFEDKRFYDHHGVDPIAMFRAVAQAIGNGRVISGGSTLTMQVARLLEESGTGKWAPKLRQIRLALALERQLSKEDILNLYLVLAPYGGNLEGIRAASLAYFGKEPTRLTPAQSALLVALPQSPETRRPDRAPDVAFRVRNRVLLRLAQSGALPEDEAQASLREGAPRTRQAFPSLAPHLADRVLSAHPLKPTHNLTIERKLQRSLETLARAQTEGDVSGISTAILVVDQATGDVLASVGSAGFLDSERQGFIDMTQAIRSPGSTLKPLIYGLAFEAGLAHPETLIEDRPTAFGDYAPQNFDNQFRGTIRVREALQLSLNIPAVSLLEAVGPAQLMARLRRAGLDPKLPNQGMPGLAIALGGVGLSLEDLVALYGGIANGGSPILLRTDKDEPSGSTLQPILGAEAAWHIADILTGVVGPANAPRTHLAYKTGTSYGHRDAWAIGFDGQHVIGVWMGRPDGASLPGILGADLAAPVLFEAFSRLKPDLTPLSAPPPSTLMVSNGDLPQPLKRFRARDAVFDLALDGPEIAFPPDGARIDLGLATTERMPLVLKVRDGKPPFTWIADGVPVLIAVRDRQAQIVPDGPGHLNISVVDADGQSQRIAVVVE